MHKLFSRRFLEKHLSFWFGMRNAFQLAQINQHWFTGSPESPVDFEKYIFDFVNCQFCYIKTAVWDVSDKTKKQIWYLFSSLVIQFFNLLWHFFNGFLECITANDVFQVLQHTFLMLIGRLGLHHGYLLYLSLSKRDKVLFLTYIRFL